MQKLKTYSMLLRTGQWYKNLLVFLPMIFPGIQNTYSIYQLIFAFIGFCSISSVTYILNDWVDKEKDAIHPTKKHRPIASGKVGKNTAIVTAISLLIIAVISGLIIGNIYYFIIISTYFVITNAYSFGLKNIPLLDISIIAINFTLRTLAGIPNIPNSESIPYFFIIFGAIIIFLTHKRRTDIKMLNEKAISHKPVLKYYTKQNSYIIRLIGYLVVSVSLYFLWKVNISIYPLISFLLLLIITSIYFSKESKLVMKPHYLLKKIIWDLSIISTIILSIFA